MSICQRKSYRRAQRRRGAAAVEFALVLPILLFTVVGILELGRLLQVQQILANAAREGARHGAADAPAADVEEIVRRYLRNQGLAAIEPSATVTSVTTGATPSGFPVYRVEISLPSSTVRWVSPIITNPSAPIVAAASWTRN